VVPSICGPNLVQISLGALAVYLLLFSASTASYYLHSPSRPTMFGALYRRITCIVMDMLRLVAAACCDMG